MFQSTPQRSDIAMAITKNDMFDFLIDIVPREEIQLRSKTQKVDCNSCCHSLSLMSVPLRAQKEEEAERVFSFYLLSCFSYASSSWPSKLCPQVQRGVWVRMRLASPVAIAVILIQQLDCFSRWVDTQIQPNCVLYNCMLSHIHTVYISTPSVFQCSTLKDHAEF